MDYKKYKFNAVIDWIEIEITTVKPTNFQTIKRHGDLWYVEAIDVGAGGTTTNFRFKLHEPKSWHYIIETIAILDRENPLLTEPTITAIEISFDAYSKGGNHDELIELTERFYRYLTNPVSQNQRFSGRARGDVEWISSRRDVRKFLTSGRNICIGNNKNGRKGKNVWKADDEYMQIYFKTTDNNGGIKLSNTEERARIEIRLRGEALPCSTFTEWNSFKFENLSHYFNFRSDNHKIFDKAPNWYKKVVNEIVAQLGAAGAYQRRKHSLLTLPDKELNNIAYESLRCLTDRMLIKQVR